MSEAKSKAKMATTSTVPAGEATPIAKGSHVYLVDGSGYIFRAFHALPPLTRPSDGLPVGAVHGFCAMLWKLLRETKAAEAPTHFAVIFDASEKTFRNEIYEDYKAHRPPPPGRARSAVRAHPRRSEGVQRRLHRAERLRGGRPHRQLRARDRRCRRRRDHRLLRQGSDAARAARRRHARRHEGQEDRPRRGDREVRRAARKGRRRAVAGRRFDRQRPRRAGHRRQDGGGADQGIRRSRCAAGARRRDQAAEAAREADRVRRPGARVARARAPQGRRAGHDPGRSAGRARSRSAGRCSASCASWSSIP